MTFLTIAIPTYKSNSTLLRLLFSIRDEVYLYPSSKVEILISDNYPTSNLREELASTLDSKFLHYIVYTKNRTNLGYDGNLGNLVDKASGIYLKFVADDDEFQPGFLENHVSLLEKTLPDIVVCNFQAIKSSTTNDRVEKYLADSSVIEINQPWDPQKLSILSGKYGQVSTLTFRRSPILHLKQQSLTNFVHVFWFFSLFELSKVIYDPNPGLIIHLGSPNFSGSFYQIVEIPFLGVSAIHQAKISSIPLRRFILKKEKSYALKGLRLFPNLKWCDRLWLLWKHRRFLNSIIILKYIPFIFVPLMIKSRIRIKKVNAG